MIKPRLWVFIGSIFLLVSYLYLSSPDRIVINDSGEIEGIINKARSTVQGKAFWEEQLHVAKSELEWELAEPERLAELERQENQKSKDLQKLFEEAYERFPEIRPSPTERLAEALRENADRIERASARKSLLSILEEIRSRRIAEIRRAIQIIEDKIERR